MKVPFDIKSLAALNRLWLTAATSILVVCLFLAGVPILDLIELRTFDLRFHSRGTIEPSSAVALAMIDERSLDVEGRWPWPRSKIAALVDALSRAGAKVIAFDIGFLEPEDAQSDGALARAIADSPASVVLGYFFHMGTDDVEHELARDDIERRLELIASSKYPLVMLRGGGTTAGAVPIAVAPEPNIPPVTAAAESSGYFSVKQDGDGVVRWMPLVIESGDEFYPPLSILAAWHYLDEPQLKIGVGAYGVETVQIGDRRIPTDESGRLLINYYGPPKTFPHASVSDILAGGASGIFKDRIAVVGATATGIYDVRSTPFGSVFPGAEIHATVIDNVLSGKFLAKPPWAKVYDVLAIVALAAVVAVALPRLGPARGLLFAAALFATHIFVARQAFVGYGVWLNVVYPLLSLVSTYTTLTAYQFLSEQRDRRKMRSAFGQYVSPIVIEQILEDPSRLKLGGEQKVLSVLFSDLQGFTSYSERYTPQQMIELLSEYYARMTERIFAREGMLKEYVGDELMAIFGAPVEQADHAARACAAALEMRAHRKAMSEEWVRTGRPPLHARTGVNSGLMLVGNLGSQYRFAYGVLGDNVNLGSRLEGMNKEYGTEILIGENTAELIGNAFVLREVDVVRVVGKKKPTRIYELVSEHNSLPQAQTAGFKLYADALEAYRAQRWTEALSLLEKVLVALPGDGPSETLTRRCRTFMEAPPAEDWDGVFEATKK